jgi:hypothetical protein
MPTSESNQKAAAYLKTLSPEMRVKVLRELLRRRRQDQLLSGSKSKHPAK